MSARNVALLSILLAWSATFVMPIQGTAQEETATVAVESRLDAKVRVSLLQGGHMVPLGLVEERGSSELTIPEFFVQADGPTHLVADVIGSNDWHRTEALTIGPSTRITFTIDSEVERSTVVVGD
jgi:hypothetical protein